ncbi:MAG: thrombospondin type 3 repeat-containing protein [Candidatus Thiodiazotropha sp. (ex Codakia rugifera)]|nr:thrombospondin type 3 repeat-containing protein [Candidatus Thiodiazotropha sp. (ex Codakia rugifera)]
MQYRIGPIKSILIALALFVESSWFQVQASESLIDSDHDGVADNYDSCSNTAQLKKLPENFRYAPAVNPARLKPGPMAYPVDEYGCEFDTDGDGIVNSQDYCPEDSKEMLSKGIAANGCSKHSDFDGTPDYRDQCPNTPLGVMTDAQGCPVK